MPAFGEEGGTSETSLFKLGKLFSARLLSATLGSGGSGVQGLGIELLRIPPTGWDSYFIVPASSSIQETISPHSNPQLCHEVNKSPRAVETVLRTSKIALNYRHAHAHTSRFEMGAPPPQAHVPVLSVHGAAG